MLKKRVADVDNELANKFPFNHLRLWLLPN